VIANVQLEEKKPSINLGSALIKPNLMKDRCYFEGNAVDYTYLFSLKG